MRFYLDEDLAPQIAVALRTRGIDAVSAHEVRAVGWTDSEQLAYATRQGRCLVTGNLRDFIRLGHGAIGLGEPHSGIVLCSPGAVRGTVGRTVQALARLAQPYPDGLGHYDVVYL